MSYVLSKKTVSTAKGVGVSSEKYPKLHLVDVMSDTWYPIPPPPRKFLGLVSAILTDFRRFKIFNNIIFFQLDLFDGRYIDRKAQI